MARSFALNPKLPRYLWEEQQRIEEYARGFGLDFFPTVFEVLTYEQMNEVASYMGFPTRYPHWRFGMEYERMAKSAEYGLSKIYEMVINNNPSIAYLLEGNSLVEQKLVMAHVYAHVDFFKNNFCFGTTDQGKERSTGEPVRKWVDTMANHGAVVRRWANRVGIEKVEAFIDDCLCLENLIDPNKPYEPKVRPKEERADGGEEELIPEELRLLRVDKDYMESFINPEEFVQAQRDKMAKEKEQAKRFPEKPDRDVLGFLIKHGNLERWERDILTVIRREAYYFYPQMQTKIMNEGWACLEPDALVFTDAGLITMKELVGGAAERVSDGHDVRAIYDQNVIADHETITVRTRRGLKLTGSTNHRVMSPDGSWRRLDELAIGEVVGVSGGSGLWASREIPIEWTPRRRITLEEVADEAGVPIWTVMRHRSGRRARRAEAIDLALEQYDSEENLTVPKSTNKRRTVRIPKLVDPSLAAFLGYLVGDGHISRQKRTLGLTTGDEPQAARFVSLANELFGLSAMLRQDGGRIRVTLSSEDLSDFLTEHLGLTHGKSAHRKRVPSCILRSPEPVVRAYLRAYFDCDGYAGKQGVILSTASEEMSEQIQLLLLNFGILSRRRAQKDGCWHVHVTGASAKVYAERLGFGLERKQEALNRYVEDRRWFEKEEWTDEVVSLERGRADVYDISVEDTHRYAAQGFVNHNSYWHSQMMTTKICDASEIIEYADRNAGVMSTSGGQLNPYKLGVELLRHVEERWNKGRFGKEWEDCDDLAARRNWDRRTGMGREKIFQVRKLYNDVTFIDEFLTPEFVVDQKLYAFGFNTRNDRWEIETRKFQEVKKRLLFSITNAGQPFVRVLDANHGNRGELLLEHDHQGIDLRLDWAREVLRALERVWGRPVEIHTIVDGKPTLLRFDGNEHVQRPMK